MNSLNARVADRRPVRRHHLSGQLAAGDHDGLRGHEAAEGNFADAMEALEDAPSTGAEHLVSWVKAVIYGAAERWTDVIDEVEGAAALAGQVPRGRRRRRPRRRRGQPRIVHRGRTPTDGVEFVARRRGMRDRDRVVPGDDAPQPGQRGVRRRAAGVAAGHPPGAESRCGAEGSELSAGDHHAGEDRFAPGSVGPGQRRVADNSGRERLLAEAQAELDRQIGLTRVKEQIEATARQPRWRRSGPPAG